MFALAPIGSAVGTRVSASHIDLPAFWITRFLVTIAQFAPFVQNGYSGEAEQLVVGRWLVLEA